MAFAGFVLKRESELHQLQESATNLGLLKRELEDLGWNLMNMNHGVKSFAEDSPEERRKTYVRGTRYYKQDPLVGRNVDMLTDYAIGQGISIPQTDNEDLRQVFSEFWNDPENKAVLTTPEAQREKDRDVQLGGNVFWTAFVNPSTGHVRLGDIPSSEVRDIISHPENRRKTMFYKRVFSPAPYDFTEHRYIVDATKEEVRYYRDWRFPEDDQFGPREGKIAEGLIFHFAPNKVADSKFGFPMTLRILTWVQAYNEFMKARVALVQAAAMFAWKRKVKGNPSEVKKIIQNFAERQFDQAGQGPAQAGMPAPAPVNYGSVLSTNENVNWEQVKTDTGGAAATADGRMIKGQVGAGYGFPLHYQGDIGGANLATATAMELPVLKMVEAHQMLWMNLMREIHDFVIESAILAGRIPAARKGRFTKDALATRHSDLSLVKEPKPAPRVAGDGSEATAVLQEGHLLEAQGDDEGEYTYKIAMPKILQRQVGETINAMVNTVKAADPYGQNVDLSRWMLQSALEVLGESEPEQVVSKVFPPGYKPPDITQVGLAERGRGDSIDGDGSSGVNFSNRPNNSSTRKPASASAVGAKGAKRARSMDERAKMGEAAVIDPKVVMHFEDIEEQAMSAINEAYDAFTELMGRVTRGEFDPAGTEAPADAAPDA
jgi:hypothetical protein